MLSGLLNGVGKRIFVEYFADFGDPAVSNQEVIARLPREYTFKSRTSRTAKARRIFREGWEYQALSIIANSNNVEPAAAAGARALLESHPGATDVIHSPEEPAGTDAERPWGDEAMAIEFEVLSKDGVGSTPTFLVVRDVADQLRIHLNEGATQQLIRERHVLGASSSGIQEIILKTATDLGFHTEKHGLFSGYQVPALRPDYFRTVDDSGILLEVERGKTIANNMDLLDLWKCHICVHAAYLFLVVPKKRTSAKGTVVNQFSRVCKRLAPFFEPKNYVNVEAVFVFGY